MPVSKWSEVATLELIRLRASYHALPSDIIQASQWSADYIERDVPYDSFRGDCAYVWQQRDHNTPLRYLVTALYLLAGPTEHLMRKMTEDGSFGAYTFCLDENQILTRDLLDAVNELAFLERHNIIRDRPTNVLDIGSGYGRLAHRMHEAYDGKHKVLCVDAIPESTLLCRRYLQYRGLPASAVVELPALRGLLRQSRPDVAVSIHVLSECTHAAIKWWLALMVEFSVPYLFIVPNAGDHKGKKLLSREQDGSRIAFEETIALSGYKLVACEPKYMNKWIQEYGVSPTHYFLFEFVAKD